jgi:hypothetical protein
MALAAPQTSVIATVVMVALHVDILAEAAREGYRA